jgi:Uma2 family endonuclease
MPESAPASRMTIEEFLTWDDGTETRYELVCGEPVATAPGSVWHNTITHNAARVIERAVERHPPCRPVPQAGILVDRGSDNFFIANVVLTCEPPAESPYVAEPRLVVEVLSPSTVGTDEKRKVPAYGRLPTVAEIWLIDSRSRWVLVWQKVEGTWIASLPVVNRATFPSGVLGVSVALDQPYRHTEVSEIRP